MGVIETVCMLGLVFVGGMLLDAIEAAADGFFEFVWLVVVVFVFPGSLLFGLVQFVKWAWSIG